MRRTQLQLDESTYEALRRRAFEQGRSISAVAREILVTALDGRKRRRLTREDLPFVGAGRSAQARLSPVSERHDEALAEAARSKRR